MSLRTKPSDRHRTGRGRLLALLGSALGALAVAAAGAEACSRVTYVGPDGTVVTGRSMDWMVSLHTNLWAFPAGLRRDGAVSGKSLAWTSKYGSVIAGAYDAATTDGMNEKGLVANLLYLATAEYGVRDPDRPGLSLAGWAQYVLDNFATVDEAVEALRSEPFQLVGPPLPGGFSPTMHLAISDSSGDSAILEYIHGSLVIHHGRQYQVMTNEPSYDQQLSLNAYWQEIGGQAMLPGTDRPADRFVRASYYLGHLPVTSDPAEAVAGVFSVMRNVSVPFGIVTPGSPNVAPTLWRSAADQRHHVYYFETTMSPNVFWVDMAGLNLAQGQPTRRLAADGQVHAGENSAAFVPAEPFAFMAAGGR